jgi:hypothetical protein
MGLLKAGLTDPIGLKVFALKEGLDFAMWMDEEKGAYESIVQNILLLYGNGEDPGQIVLTQHMLRPDIQMRVLSAFMTSPIMAAGSVRGAGRVLKVQGHDAAVYGSDPARNRSQLPKRLLLWACSLKWVPRNKCPCKE